MIAMKAFVHNTTTTTTLARTPTVSQYFDSYPSKDRQTENTLQWLCNIELGA